MTRDPSQQQPDSRHGSDDEFIIEESDPSVDVAKEPSGAPEMGLDAGSRLRKLSVRSLVIFGLSLAFLIGALVYFESDQPSPGALAAVHGRVARLTGGSGCVVCHGDAEHDLSDACLDCHGVITEQISQDRGLHGHLEAGTRRSCDLCHIEHHGSEFDIIGKRSFLIAGYFEREDFDHSGLGFVLEGCHLEADCKACHEFADIPILPEGEKRFLGLSGDCISCHEDPHDAKLPNCTDCHGQVRPFDQVANFVHDERFPLVGGHDGVACSECHREGSDASLASLRGNLETGERADVEVRACGSCHDSSHRQDFVRGVADILGADKAQVCSQCHQSDRSTFSTDSLGMGQELHAATGFSLLEPHMDLKCTQCHSGLGRDQPGATGPDFAALFPGRKPEDCAQCHEDAHHGQFTEGVFADQGCITCHDTQGFRPTSFGLDEHALTSFPLDGSHVAVGCFECHEMSAGEDGFRIFHGTTTACESCHEDIHEGAFDRLGSMASQGRPGGCARCHQASSFKDLRGSFDHGFWTGFGLRGSHQRADCRDCHKGAVEIPGGLGSAGKTCADCHPDVHGGQFIVDGASDCSRCHSAEGSFAELSFDHDRESRFALDEHHAELDCRECHRPYAFPNGESMIRFKPLGVLCADCHLPEQGRVAK